MRVFTVIRASLLVGPTRHGDHYYCECTQYNVITGRCYAAGYAPRDKRRIGRGRSCAHAHLGRLFRTAKNHCEDLCAGPMVEPSTWAVITASAVRRTVTHVNAHHGSKAAILAPEKLLFRLALSKKCLPRDEGEERGEGDEGDSARTRGVYPGD